MSEIEEYIMAFADDHSSFTTFEMLHSFPSSLLCSRSTVDWYLSKLTKEGSLGRIGRGRYSSKVLSKFVVSDDETDKSLYDQLADWYPDAAFCVYKGGIFTSLQHHLSYNALTYIETQRELTESVFRRLQDIGMSVFHRPDKKVFYDYIDISGPGIIVKPLISGSPLQKCCSVLVPMLEKILVDIRCDDDFDYMGGGEAYRMLENAVSLYAVNATKLLRYAGRRNCRAEFEKDLKELGL